MNIQKMMHEAQKMQNTLKKKISEFEDKVFEYKYKEYVEIKIKGNLMIESIIVNKDIIDESDTTMLNDILQLAINEAISSTKQEKEKISNSVASGLGGLF